MPINVPPLHRAQMVCINNRLLRYLSLDTTAKTVTLHGNPLTLTQREYLLLELMLSQPKHILSRAQMEDKLYGWDQEVESNAIEVHIHNLRKKIGKNFIITKRGLGYQIGEMP